MDWFLREIYPRVQARVPDVCLEITGDHADLPLPPATNVVRTGRVDDIRPLVAGATASLVPIRLGGGTRLKILEAMALDTPVIATAKGAEGLDVRHDEHLLIADTPEDYARAVVRVLVEPGLRERLTRNARLLVRAKYDWEVVLPDFQSLCESVAGLSQVSR
jgi:glycosyltransferase involved in cell wall biosynthesis